jgi:error-prone DNA polymerase
LKPAPELLREAPIEEEDLSLPEAPEGEEVVWDYAATGLTLRRHPLAILRPALSQAGWKSDVLRIPIPAKGNALKRPLANSPCRP